MNLLNKNSILNTCINIQQDKVDKLKCMVETLNDSAVNSDKCVVGDKHHTFRAQTQNEQEIYAKQFNNAINDLNTIKLISKDKKYEKGELGALINTSNGVYLLATSMGIINIEDNSVMVISPISPIGNLLLFKTAGDTINFRGNNITILKIY